MIISISGKIDSGKDTVGKIIQYLIYCNKKGLQLDEVSFKDFNNDIDNPNQASNWEIKKFADTLKDCVCLILGCTREQLEDREFKNKELDEEWIRYGYANGTCKDINGNPMMLTEECSKEKYEEERRINWQTAYKHEHTPRSIMQMLGTEVGRHIHKDTWVNALMSNYKVSYANNPAYGNKGIYGVTEEFELTNPPMLPNWIITDTRFPNEIEAIVDRGGILIKTIILDDNGEHFKYDDNHPSETALDDYKFTYEVRAKLGDIKSMINQVKDILELEEII